MKPGTGKKVLVAMSGGVDSAVTAALLKERGYAVVGCFMRLGSDDSFEAETLGYDNLSVQKLRWDCGQTRAPGSPRGHKQGCCSVNDAADARLVSAMLDIPFYVMNFKKDFGRIIDYFVDEYNAGRTPNPCVRCNDWLKFGKLHDYAQSIDCDFVATGHYARITRPPADSSRGLSAAKPRIAPPQLHRGVDLAKDQSYVLFGTPRNQLAHMLLPIGELEKTAVRQIADELGLPVFNKPDSQEICFVPDNDYAKLVERRTEGGFVPGKIVDTVGHEVGTHDGHQHFTLGQRRGVGVALGYPIYVVDKNPDTHTVTIGSKRDLLADGCTADQTNFLTNLPDTWTDGQAKVRYNSDPVPARFRVDAAGLLEVAFHEPVEAVTPGQAVVCYDGTRVLGGGWVRDVQKSQAATPVSPPTAPTPPSRENPADPPA